MAKNTNRVASAIAYVAALGLATGTWAAVQWEVEVKNPVIYAQEIFGGDNPDDLDVELNKDNTDSSDGDQSTHILIKLATTVVGDVVNITEQSRVEFNLTIENATFGQAVRWTDIVPSGDLLLVGGSQTGGNAGSNTLGFQVKVATGQSIDANDVASGQEIKIRIGSLEDASSGLLPDALGNVATVTVKSLTAGITAGLTGQTFPSTVAPIGRTATDCVDKSDPQDDDCDDAGDINALDALPNVIASSAVGLKFTGGPGEGGSINIEDRTKLVAAGEASVASLTITPNDDAVNAANKKFSANEGVNASVTVTVDGMVRDADSIFFDANNNKKEDAGEGLTITGGVASNTFRLANTKSGAMVYYSPGGTVPMRQGLIKASFAVKYDSTTAVTPEAVTGGAELVYAGVSMKARAYAIPNAGMGDVANVRIKCDASKSAMCTVFLECNGQDGKAYFGELSDISGGVTRVLQAEGIGEVIDADTWAGRLSCDVLSNNNVSVQVLVRSDGSLINNTYVDSMN